MTCRTLLGAASVAALLAAAPLAAPLAQAATPAAGEALAEEQTFSYNVIDEFVTLDPALIEVVDDNDVARQLFEGLMNQDPQGNVVPGVATGFEVSEDRLTYTFTLRPEARWSNGEPVRAQDFVYAWRRVVDPATASNYSWYMGLAGVVNADAIVAGEVAPDQLGVAAPDDRTLVVTLSRPAPFFPQMTANANLFPVLQSNVEEFGDQWTQAGNMISNGAYTLTERVPQERIVMTKSPTYWDAGNVVIETINALVVTDENQAVTRWRDGELDKTAVIPAGQFPTLKEELGEETVAVPNLCTYFYFANLREDGPEALKDPRVREALSLAIDRSVVVDAILAGGQQAAFTLTHEATAGFEAPEVPAAAMTQEERNARAQELLAEAGYGEGAEPLTVEISFNTSESHQQIAVAIGQMWKQTLGIDATTANQEWQTFLDARKEGAFELARAAWCADYNEASTFLDILTADSEANDAHYVNPDYDALLEAALTAEDPLPQYQEAEAIIARDVPILPVYFYASNFLLNDAIKGWPMENAQQYWYAKDMYRVAEE
jgi:oligopeptide transport system substrate-binding protein